MKSGICKKNLLVFGLSVVSAALMACGWNSRQSQQSFVADENTESSYTVAKEKSAVKSSAQLELPALRKQSGEQILKRVGYTVSYNSQMRLPNWVAWRLTASHVNGKWKRSGIRFQEDQDVAKPRATDTDYYNSGYDRGHMCPSGDNKWSEQAQIQSFLFTNCCPQIHGLNAGDWNEIEAQCRRWAKQYGDVYIVSGPIVYKGKRKTIGRNKVVVPDAFFKVVLRMNPSPAAIGFVYKNVSGNRPKSAYVNTVDEVERITGLDFFAALPDRIENKVEAVADLNDWSK